MPESHGGLGGSGDFRQHRQEALGGGKKDGERVEREGDLISPSVGGEGRGPWGSCGSWEQPKDLGVNARGAPGVVGATESPARKQGPKGTTAILGKVRESDRVSGAVKEAGGSRVLWRGPGCE